MMLTSQVPMYSMHDQSQQNSYSTGTKVAMAAMSALGIGWQLLQPVTVSGKTFPIVGTNTCLLWPSPKDSDWVERRPWILAKFSGREIQSYF